VDKSERYADMCLMAEEALNMHQKYSKEIPFHQHDYIYKIDNYRDLGCCIVWLPRIDQLIEMLDYDCILDVISQVYDFALDNHIIYCNCTGNSNWTIEQLYLAFVMKEKFNKVWKEEEKDWVKR